MPTSIDLSRVTTIPSVLRYGGSPMPAGGFGSPSLSIDEAAVPLCRRLPNTGTIPASLN
jgi:hypothetical protein